MMKLRLLKFFRLGKLDELSLSQFEEQLILADVGMDLSKKLVEKLGCAGDLESAKKILHDELIGLLSLFTGHRSPVTGHRVLLFLGVNGCGKTTTIAKLANRYKSEGKKVLMIAGDTFRAAAIDQLYMWGKKLCVDVFSKTGSDSASVVFDGINHGIKNSFDVVLIDTAGRLHNNYNLMEELKKISRVAGKARQGAPDEKILVIDSTIGSNSLVQAREFNKALGLTSLVVAKLDGTAKGGIVFSIANEIKIPISYIGTGEGMDDLMPFDPEKFVDEILA